MPGMRGFSLAEVVVAFLVVTLAVLALVSVQIYVLRAQAKTTERSTASTLAASRLNSIESVLLQDFYAPVAASRAPLPEPPGFELAVTDEVLDQLREVHVAVYWTDANGPQEQALWTRFLRP